MKVVMAALTLVLLANTTPICAESNPCENVSGNAPIRECYAKAKARANVEVDGLASKIASQFRKEARDYDDVIAARLRKAASGVTRSQEAWKAYREQHCTAILDSYTTGTGAETAYEKCQFQLAQERLLELRSAFPFAQTK